MPKYRTPKSAFAFLLCCSLLAALILAGCKPAPAPRSATPTPAGEEHHLPVSPSETPLPSPTPSVTPQPASRLGVDPADLQGVEIQFWHTLSGPAGAALKLLVDMFNRQNEWGIHVETTSYRDLDELDARLRQAMMAKNSIEEKGAPDLVVGSPHQALDWNATHPLVDLNEYVNDPIWGLASEDQADFYPAFWEQNPTEHHSSDAGTALPGRFGMPFQRSGELLYYNRSWARQLGFNSPPETPEEFQQQACAAARANLQDENADNDQTGGWIISTNYSSMRGWLNAFGSQIYDAQKDATTQNPYVFNTPEVEEALTFLRKLYDEHCAWLSESAFPQAEFASRLGLFSTGSLVGIAGQQQAIDHAGKGDEWTVIPFLSPEGKPALPVFGSSVSILTSEPERQLAAWLFAKWLLEPQNIARLVETTGAFPLRQTALPYLEDYRKSHPQWAAALEFLPEGQAEPPFQSWNVVRWALTDAATQLYRSYFSIDQTPELVRLLDRTAADLHAERYLSAAPEIPSPTPTRTPGPSPSATARPSATSTPVTPTSTPRPSPTMTKTPTALAPAGANPTQARTPGATPPAP